MSKQMKKQDYLNNYPIGTVVTFETSCIYHTFTMRTNIGRVCSSQEGLSMFGKETYKSDYIQI